MGVTIKLDKDDTRRCRNYGYVYVDKYIIVLDKVTGDFEYGIVPEEIDYYNHDEDNIDLIMLDMDVTDVIYNEEYDEDDEW